jgi:hypothetical protein
MGLGALQMVTSDVLVFMLRENSIFNYCGPIGDYHMAMSVLIAVLWKIGKRNYRTPCDETEFMIRVHQITLIWELSTHAYDPYGGRFERNRTSIATTLLSHYDEVVEPLHRPETAYPCLQLQQPHARKFVRTKLRQSRVHFLLILCDFHVEWGDFLAAERVAHQAYEVAQRQRLMVRPSLSFGPDPVT